MLNLLFSSRGIIDRDSFTKGALVLLALNFFLWPLWFVHTGLGSMAGWVALISGYNWYCLFAKRLRAGGYSPGLFFAFWLMFAVLTTMTLFFVASIRLAIRANADPELLEKMEAMQTMDRQNPDVDMVMDIYGQMGEVSVIPAGIIYLIFGAVIALGVNSVFRSRPE